MKKIRNYLLLLFYCIVLFTTACIKQDPVSDPEQSFDVFWNDVNTTYCFFNYNKVNWDSIYTVYHPQVNPATTNDQLFQIFQYMLTPLIDGHIALFKSNGQEWQNPKHLSYPDYFYSPNVLNYLSGSKVISTTDNNGSSTPTLWFGNINTTILYFNVRTFYNSYPFHKTLDSLLKSSNYKGLILDLRTNYGGSYTTMDSLASVFTNTTRPFAYYQSKTGTLPNQFGPLTAYTINHNNSDTVFTNPVVVLTNRYTASAAERMRLALKILPNVTVVGDTTWGALGSDITRTLPNGMQFTMAVNIVYDLNMKIYESVGIPPDITVITSPADSALGKDDMIEKAIQLLQ